MNVHLFGATSSPNCANFTLRATASAGESIYGKEATDCVRKDFYVDNFLKSTFSVPHAISLLQFTIELCASGGFPLLKVISNSSELLEAVPVDQRKSEIKEFESALGFSWDT